jgi:hypothetical protein
MEIQQAKGFHLRMGAFFVLKASSATCFEPGGKGLA